ncbi:MAG TPA: peptide chain release factor N(5)-glutamine methyltransferase [Firmicutes bacterium]|nr:peptide chain release factor N(5)-glutamine methyltransferase [Bacillota bacterium]
MTIGEIITKTVPFFADKGIPGPRLEADLLLAHILDMPRVKLYSEWDRPLEPREIQQYRGIIVKRVQGLPLAYLIGKKSFLSWDLAVTPDVLIPRPETEILVEAAYDLFKNRTVPIRGVDVGTGSGAIVIALAKLMVQSEWLAIDISEQAVKIAQENACSLAVDSRITFLTGDLLEPILKDAAPEAKFDLIVSNPPYIPSAEIAKLQVEVRQEPRLALDGGSDGLDIYRRLFPQVKKVISEDGVLILEHGDDQRSLLESIALENGFSSESLTDLAGRERVLICRPGKVHA